MPVLDDLRRRRRRANATASMDTTPPQTWTELLPLAAAWYGALLRTSLGGCVDDIIDRVRQLAIRALKIGHATELIRSLVER